MWYICFSEYLTNAICFSSSNRSVCRSGSVVSLSCSGEMLFLEQQPDVTVVVYRFRQGRVGTRRWWVRDDMVA